MVLTGVLLVGCIGRASAAASPTLLDVWVNGRSLGKIGEFTIQGDVLAASPEELAELGLAPKVVQADGLTGLVRDTEFSWHIDMPQAAIYVTASDSRLVRQIVPATVRKRTEVVESATGVTFNYDLTFLTTPQGNSLSGVVEGRIFSPLGILSTDAFLTYGTVTSGLAPRTVRLDSTYAISFPGDLLRLRLGDFVTSGVVSSRAVRLGGIQFGSDFGLRPDLITMPLPTLHASAAVPTTADVLINGNFASSIDVGSGPFEVRNVPVVTGAGTVSLNLRDAGGNAVSRTFAYYASNALLAPGLQSFVFQLGALRRNFGLNSNDYGPWAASASYRRGLSSRLTVEGHAELSATTALGQAGVSANLADLAIATQSLSVSVHQGRSGFQSISQLEHNDHVFNARLSYTLASAGFRDIAAGEGAPINRQQIEANVGFSLGGYGNLSLTYVRTDQIGLEAPNPSRSIAERIWHSGARIGSLELLTANYSIQRGQLTVYANAFASMGEGRSHQFMLGMSIPFGRRDQANVSVQMLGERWQAGAQVSRGTDNADRWGYQAGVWRGPTDSQSAEVQYQSPLGWMSAGIDNTGGRTSGRLQVRGSVSAIDGAVYPSPSIASSFAIVDTAGMPGIKVFNENRLVGRTGRTGKLLIADLRSFEANHVAIDPTDLPADMIVASGERTVRPQDRSGVVLRFPLEHSNAALVRLTDEANQPIPAGSIVTLEATGATSPMGYDGEVFVEGLSAVNNLSIERPGSATCTASVRYQASAGDIPRLGPFVCQDLSR